MAKDLDCRVGNGDADDDLVGLELERSLGPDPVVTGQEQDRPMAMACPLQAMITGLGKESSRFDSSKPPITMALA